MRPPRDSRLKGVEHMLSQIKWQHFCTFTFSCPCICEKQAASCYRAFRGKLLRKFVGKSRLKRKRLLDVAQIEFGQSQEHVHLHVLLAGLPKGIPSDDIKNMWENCVHEAGIAEVTTYDPNRDGVSYALKIWRDPQQVSLIQSHEGWPIYSDSIPDTLRRAGGRSSQC